MNSNPIGTRSQSYSSSQLHSRLARLIGERVWIVFRRRSKKAVSMIIHGEDTYKSMVLSQRRIANRRLAISSLDLKEWRTFSSCEAQPWMSKYAGLSSLEIQLWQRESSASN